MRPERKPKPAPLPGRIVFVGAGWRAETADGRSLGVFDSRAEAQEAASATEPKKGTKR